MVLIFDHIEKPRFYEDENFLIMTTSKKVFFIHTDGRPTDIFDNFEGEILYALPYEDSVFIQTSTDTFLISPSGNFKINRRKNEVLLCRVCFYQGKISFARVSFPKKDRSATINFFGYIPETISVGQKLPEYINIPLYHASNWEFDISRYGTFVAKDGGYVYYFTEDPDTRKKYTYLDKVFITDDYKYYNLEDDGLMYDAEYEDLGYEKEDLKYYYGLFKEKNISYTRTTLCRGNRIQLFNGDAFIFEKWIVNVSGKKVRIYPIDTDEIFKKEYIVMTFIPEGSKRAVDLAECYNKSSLFLTSEEVDSYRRLQINRSQIVESNIFDGIPKILLPTHEKYSIN